MKLRVVERPWDIERRRYAVEQLRWEVDGEQGWGVERFFERVLDAQLFMASYAKGPRVISELPQGAVSVLKADEATEETGADRPAAPFFSERAQRK